MDMPKNHYIVLGIDRGADQKQIKSAYRRIAKKYHPDMARSEASSKKFIELREAYEILSDAHKRKAYDRELNGKKGSVRISAQPAAIHRSSDGSHASDRLRAVIDDFFGDFFTNFQYRRNPTPPDADIYLEAVLTADEARWGGVFPVTLPVVVACPRCAQSTRWEMFLCPLCSGTGQVEIKKQFSLEIPPHVRNGALLQFSLNESGTRGVQVHIVIRIEPDWP
jgi:molecular chaperone DnaJ